MRITTLGPLAVDGRPVRGDRLAAVIRELVEARGRAVSTGALIDAVWQGAPPEDAVGAVQALVGRARRLGLPVLAAPGGYRIPADEVEIDAVAARALIDRGRRALAEGDVAGARGCADQARALFPEVPELPETGQARLSGDPAALRLIRDAAALRLIRDAATMRLFGDAATVRLFGDAVALRAEAALAGGGPFDEADLRRLAARVPPSEPAAALLVRVLAAQGRDAEALDLVERVRAELADRYGTDPSPVLAEAHLSLLRGHLAPTPPRTTGNLPAAWRRAATPLVGRDSDLAAVGKALLTAPVVTVVATGGAGKTRLAAEIARSVSGSRPVRVVELAGLRSPAEVLPAVLAVLDGAGTGNPVPDHRVPNPEHRVPNPEQRVPNPEQRVPNPEQRVPNPEHRVPNPEHRVPNPEHRHLSPAERVLRAAERVLRAAERLKAIGSEFSGLLVLDNCEHVLDAAATVVADLLAVASPEVSVLATSRAPLGLLGEVVHRLPALADDEALDLLDARVRDGGTAPAWPRDRALALCRRLDNLPLALELAAARLRHMPLDDVLAGLGDRFALLDDALRGLPERHAGLWAMVDWSRELLGPAEQRLLERLAVIPAPFTTESAGATAGGADVPRGLSILVEQSLLRLEDDRYRMLETVREYGEARLDASGERATAMAGLVGWARARAVALAADFIGPAQVKALDGCAADQDNLLAALRWTLDHDDEPAAVDVALALFQLWTVRGRHLEAGAWARLLLRLDEPAARPRSAILHGRTSGRPLPHADRLAWLCVLIAVNAGSTASSRLIALARRALRTLFAERPGDVSSRVTALAGALSGLEQADPDRSLADAATLIAHPDPYVQGMGHFFRAVLTENTTTQYDAELAYRRFEALGDHWGMAMAAHAAGHATSTDTWLRRSEQHLELVGAAQDARSTRVLLDTQLAFAGDAEAERRLRETARADHADETDACQADLALAQLALRRGRHDEALAHTEALLRTIGGDDGPAQQRTVFRIAAAVLDLWIAEARAATETTAADTLRQSRTEVMTAHDRPLLGAWAMAGAELAAFRGDTATARELWALGTRVGANVSRFFPQGRGVRLAAALGERERLLAEAGELSGAVVYGRINKMMDDLLA